MKIFIFVHFGVFLPLRAEKREDKVNEIPAGIQI